MANNKLRAKAKKAGVRLWEIGEALGMDDAAFSRKLRHELVGDQKIAAFKCIDEIAAKRGAKR